MTRTNESGTVAIRFECPICGGPHPKADHPHDEDADDAQAQWWWIKAEHWDDCHGCGQTIEAADVVAYHPDGILLDATCAECDRLEPRLSKALARRGWRATATRYSGGVLEEQRLVVPSGEGGSQPIHAKPSFRARRSSTGPGHSCTTGRGDMRARSVSGRWS